MLLKNYYRLLSEEGKKVDFVTVTVMMMMIPKPTLMNVADEQRSTETSFGKDKGSSFEIIHICSYNFGPRQVKAGDEA